MANQTVTSVELLNTIRAAASTMYQESIPQATQDNIAEVGTALEAYDPTFNEFTKLLAKIALTVSYKRYYRNPLAVFKRADLETANMIEEYFMRKVNSVPQDKDGANALAPKRPTFSMTYHKENVNETYETTTSFKQIRNAFRNREGVVAVMNDIVSSMLSDAEIDEFYKFNELVKRAVDGSFTVTTDAVTNEATGKALVKAIRKVSSSMTRPQSTYHNATLADGVTKDDGIVTFSERDKQVLFITSNIEAEVGVEVLASAFNRGDANYPVERVIILDDLGENVNAILADESLLVIHDTFNALLTQENAKGAFTNYYLHLDQLLALSPYANVAVFKTVGE